MSPSTSTRSVTRRDSPDRDKYAVPIRQFHAARVADLAKRLAAIPEGNGTMLDSTLIIWMSDSAEEHHGQGMQWPLVLVGNLGGKLKTAGRYLQFPKYNTPGHRTLGNFYLSLLHAVGDQREKFGDSDLGAQGHRHGRPADGDFGVMKREIAADRHESWRGSGSPTGLSELLMPNTS